jgi:hypothetical protein
VELYLHFPTRLHGEVINKHQEHFTFRPYRLLSFHSGYTVKAAEILDVYLYNPVIDHTLLPYIIYILRTHIILNMSQSSVHSPCCNF